MDLLLGILVPFNAILYLLPLAHDAQDMVSCHVGRVNTNTTITTVMLLCKMCFFSELAVVKHQEWHQIRGDNLSVLLLLIVSNSVSLCHMQLHDKEADLVSVHCANVK